MWTGLQAIPPQTRDETAGLSRPKRGEPPVPHPNRLSPSLERRQKQPRVAGAFYRNLKDAKPPGAVVLPGG